MAGLSIWPRMAEILYNQLKWYGSNWQADIFHANIYKSVESHYNKYGHTCTNYEDILVFPNGYCPVPMSSRSQKWMENSNGCRWLEFQPGTRKMFIDVHEAPENSAIMSGNNPFLFVIIADYRILRSNQLHFDCFSTSIFQFCGECYSYGPKYQFQVRKSPNLWLVSPIYSHLYLVFRTFSPFLLRYKTGATVRWPWPCVDDWKPKALQLSMRWGDPRRWPVGPF